MPTPGPLELVIILVIALLILGPGRLPDVGASLGKSIREFRKASSDVQDAVKVDVETSPLPPAAAATAPTAPAAEAPVQAPAPQPAVAAHAADLPGAPTVASTPTASTPSSEPTPGTN
ncbi:MAG TPA: twin-arginine translocase TatA/TatE family subunit [Candidatus Saccharimonadales bacterium]|nr:twin-arginine translocase TatA/TatE family subunit [Candidatus Saccharimonadales bacterium]